MFERLRRRLVYRKPQQEYEKKWPDLEIQYLIYSIDVPESGAAIVFIDPQDDLDWLRDNAYEQYMTSQGFENAFGRIWNEVSTLEPWVQNWPKDLKLSAKRALGEALGRAFRCDEVNANAALNNARRFILRKSREVSRYWTLQACTVGAGLGALAGVAAIFWSRILISGFGQVPYLLFLAFCSGTIGALLSIILRLGKVNLDAKAERRLHQAEGFARIIAGGISGVLVGGLVRLGVFLPIFSHTGMLTTAICCTAIIAGSSERLVPSIISKIETNHELLTGDE